jgi:hypothetical protein
MGCRDTFSIGSKQIQDSSGPQPADAEGEKQVENQKHQRVMPHGTNLPKPAGFTLLPGKLGTEKPMEWNQQ